MRPSASPLTAGTSATPRRRSRSAAGRTSGRFAYGCDVVDGCVDALSGLVCSWATTSTRAADDAPRDTTHAHHSLTLPAPAKQRGRDAGELFELAREEVDVVVAELPRDRLD